jgi:hypothetical protein
VALPASLEVVYLTNYRMLSFEVKNRIYIVPQQQVPVMMVPPVRVRAHEQVQRDEEDVVMVKEVQQSQRP